MVLDRYPNYRRLAEEALTLSRELLSRWPAHLPIEAEKDPLRSMIHSTLSRQTDRLDGLLILHDHQLGHIGAGLARLGYEEIIWLAWFAEKVVPEERLGVLRTLVQADLGQRIKSQWAFLDAHEHAQYGFASDALAALEPQISTAEADVAHTWARYGFGQPRYPLQLPSVYKVGKTLANRRGQHEYLFTAASQHVHFSPWRLWQSPSLSLDGQVEPQAASLKRRESAYALGWVLNYLVNVIVLGPYWEPHLVVPLEVARPHYRLVAERISKDLDSVGLPPLVEAHELVVEDADD